MYLNTVCLKNLAFGNMGSFSPVKIRLVFYWPFINAVGHEGLAPGPLADTKISRCSSPLNKKAYLHITYADPPVYFQLSVDYL